MCLLYSAESVSPFDLIPCPARDPAGHNFRRFCGDYGEARHSERSATQGGPGTGRPRAQRVLLETGTEHSQSHRSAA